MKLLKSGVDDAAQQAIDMMDEYGLSREDVFETMDEFLIGTKKDTDRVRFGALDSKDKAAFTRLYNAGVHKSQALVAEQGVDAKKRKKKVVDVTEEGGEDDGGEQSEDDEEDDKAALAAFAKKKRGGAAKGKAKNPAAPKKSKK